MSLPEAVQSELVRDLSSVHGVWQILLVGKDKQKGVTKLVLIQHALELLTSFRDTLAVVRVNHKDDTMGVLEVCNPSRKSSVHPAQMTIELPDAAGTCLDAFPRLDGYISSPWPKVQRAVPTNIHLLLTVPPEGTDLVLSTDVPDGEGNVLVLDSLDVEP